MTYSTRVQIAQEEQLAKRTTTQEDMMIAANRMKIDGEFPKTASAMDNFLRDLITNFPRNRPKTA